MLRLAGEAADGVLLNYLPASHVQWCVEQVRRGGGATIYANVHVGVGDPVAAAPQARRDLFSYAVVDAYARSFSQAGFGDAVDAIRAAHRAGERAAALAAVPGQMIDAIDVVGSPALVSDTIAAYRRAGVQVPVIFPPTWEQPGTSSRPPSTPHCGPLRPPRYQQGNRMRRDRAQRLWQPRRRPHPRRLAMPWHQRPPPHRPPARDSARRGAGAG
jgi:alkanesulfonate monooxygenase SsuD/methylene tetrahydromethanopterin reductase-like flavin-dependent oxidoreductase (luciferase family)